MNIKERLTGSLIGLAVGDALGMVVEFEMRGNFKPVFEMKKGGPFDLPAGYWTDDTSMALCLADSIVEKEGYDSYDVMDRYLRWRWEGYRSSTGSCFDIGNQTASALNNYEECETVPTSKERIFSAGNGSIMRLAPVIIASVASGNSLKTAMDISAISARDTHYSFEAEQMTAVFGGLLYNATKANSKDEVFDFSEMSNVQEQVTALVEKAIEQTEETLKPTGYVINTLEVAIWAFMTTDNFGDGMVKAVNMGGDADTIGAVYGQLAGAYYGVEDIPIEWRKELFQYEEILDVATRLTKVSDFKVIRTRFEEDEDTFMIRDMS